MPLTKPPASESLIPILKKFHRSIDSMKKKSSARSASQRRNRTRLVILTTIALVVLSGLYLIGERSESGTTFSQQSRTDEHSPSQKKFRATRNLVIDEATGNPRKPTDAELDQLLATLEKLANTSTEGLREYPLEKGGYGMDLQGRFQGVFLSRPRPDGTLEIKCVFTFEEGLEFLGIVEDSTGTSGL